MKLEHRSRIGLALHALCLAAALAAGPTQAAPEAAFEAAFQQFSSASAGDSAAVDRAAAAFDALLAAEPANPVLMVYAGASLTMRARTTMLPWKKISYAEDGMALIDKAIAMLTPAHDAAVQHGTPGSLEVRFVAANTFLAVPSFMNRGTRGAKLLGEVLASPLLTSSPPSFRAQVWMRAAKLAQAEMRHADARRWLEEVVKSGAPQAEAAQTMLNGLPS